MTHFRDFSTRQLFIDLIFFVSLSYFACVSCDVSMFHFLIAWWREIEVPLCNHAGCIVWIEYADLKLNRHMICCVTRVLFSYCIRTFLAQGASPLRLLSLQTRRSKIELYFLRWKFIFTASQNARKSNAIFTRFSWIFTAQKFFTQSEAVHDSHKSVDPF